MFADVKELLDNLDSVHARTRKVVLCFPPADVEWAPAKGKFTFGDLVRHLANIERWMYAENVEGKPSRYRGCGEEFAKGFEETLSYYDRLHAESRAIFATLAQEDLVGKSVTPAGTPITTWKWLRAMIEHEAHHRGQIIMLARQLGQRLPASVTNGVWQWTAIQRELKQAH